MERIRVGWRDSAAHHVQSAVSGLKVGEKFAPTDIQAGQNENAVRSALIKMNCIKRLRKANYEKIFDPRVLLTKHRSKPLPEVCAKCYFAQTNTSGPVRSDCIILADYRIKIL